MSVMICMMYLVVHDVYLWCFCMMCDIYGKSICVPYDVSVVFVVCGMSVCCVMCMVCGNVCVSMWCVACVCVCVYKISVPSLWNRSRELTGSGPFVFVSIPEGHHQWW